MNPTTARSCRHGLFLWLCLPLIFFGCNSASDRGSRSSSDPPLVITTNYPLRYFSDYITKGGCDVVFPVPQDVAPEAWQPDEAAIVRIQGADQILTNGPEPVSWLTRADAPPSRVVDTTNIFGKHLLREDATSVTATPENSSVPYDRFTWLDPRLAIHQAETCLETLARLTPSLAMDYQTYHGKLHQELEELDAQLTQISSEYGSEPLLAAVPRYNYLSRRCGLNLKSFDWSADKMPDESEWNKLRAVLKGHPAKWMFFPSEPAPEITKRLKALGIQTVVVETLETPPKDGDYVEVMRGNYERLEEVFRSLAAIPVKSTIKGLPRDLRTPQQPPVPKAPATKSLPRSPKSSSLK